MQPILETIHKGKKQLPPRFLIYGVEGIGKAQPLDAKILTPQGFVMMSQLKVGDYVIGSNGKPSKILGIYPQGEKEVFDVVFRDGSQTQCCDDHLWFTQTRGERNRNQPGSVRTLKTVRNTLRYGTHFNHAIPRVEPVKFTTKELPIDPWLLGAYLGDGFFSGGAGICNSENDIRQRIVQAAPEGDTCSESGYASLKFRLTKRNNQKSGMAKALINLGLETAKSEDKFVPAVYLHGDIDQRCELLRGLFDSDGFVSCPGAIEYSTVSKRLADDVCFLVRSLGGSARLATKWPTYTHKGKKKKGQLAYRIHASFPNGIVPVSSEKHLANWQAPQWQIRHTIRSVEPAGKKQCQCIKIDALDSLYVTDDFIVTHNTTCASNAPESIFIQTEDGLGEIDCHSFPLAKNFDDVRKYLWALEAEDHGYKTAVIDTADWLERIIHRQVCEDHGCSSIEDIGYAKGYKFAVDYWMEVLDRLNQLRINKGMAIIILAHAKLERVEDPEHPAFDRYSPDLHRLVCSTVVEWADAVMFARYNLKLKAEDVGFGKKRQIASTVKDAQTQNNRVLRCIGGPACIAKNRYSMPAEIPMEWQAIINSMSTKNKEEANG